MGQITVGTPEPSNPIEAGTINARPHTNVSTALFSFGSIGSLNPITISRIQRIDKMVDVTAVPGKRRNRTSELTSPVSAYSGVGQNQISGTVSASQCSEVEEHPSVEEWEPEDRQEDSSRDCTLTARTLGPKRKCERDQCEGGSSASKYCRWHHFLDKRERDKPPRGKE
jgi:hypothetical protein